MMMAICFGNLGSISNVVTWVVENLLNNAIDAGSLLLRVAREVEVGEFYGHANTFYWVNLLLS